MNNTIKYFLAAAFIMAVSSLHAAEPLTAPVRESGLKITARIYEYARLPSGVLSEAEEHATRILHKAGVETEWLDCGVSAVEPLSPACERPFAGTDLILKLLPTAMERAIATRRDALGRTLTDKDQPATTAFIFCGEIQDLATTESMRESEILAAVMAHEIGHLLLGPGHSPSGIMRANWTRDELEMISIGQLVFTPEQSALLRAEANARANSLTASSHVRR